ncbi:helix-turn-helix domain-containing protein [Klebsiella quasipneumoniae]|uniref:helix-turn-helix domain-containing protein n=1 Tax=Klebsiella quasipneumoniae TaxID=1463165 RepID=UPI0008090799|nr:helix-turn-helix domain-containing protein [Klebsiella quasipneumoniae]MBU5393594.1 helix-turn-helix domain-containing protein [Klebsiella quasipneumoniae]MBV7686833.1 helix-turn-helix domain-containing protein [Klebsiella quasipneumoniae subsp. similipneumoniae]MCC7953316.1 helix-turn-helix domain containing protein [Klebsiella quasipneumoniae]MCJ7322634.1 helix-turn-helix domain-containing protein [Klebsiella quasipneumoniae]MCY0048988.1 helix-turn-helix domain-containing protein [Klebsie
MTAHAAEFFTLDEVNRLKIIQDVVDRRLTTQMAAQRLGISDRQCRRLLSRYRESGPLGMANRRRGKPSNNQLPDGLARYALSIIRERYADFGPTLACEKLAELHDVHLSKETVRSLMVKAGFWVPRKQRAPKIQQPRYRRACCGELIQIDRLSEIDQGAIVDNKRLGRTLEYIKLVQDKRDNNRSQAIPAGDGPSRRRRKPTDKKSQRSLNGDDMLEALKVLQSRSGEIFGSNTQKT